MSLEEVQLVSSAVQDIPKEQTGTQKLKTLQPTLTDTLNLSYEVVLINYASRVHTADPEQPEKERQMVMEACGPCECTEMSLIIPVHCLAKKLKDDDNTYSEIQFSCCSLALRESSSLFHAMLPGTTFREANVEPTRVCETRMIA